MIASSMPVEPILGKLRDLGHGDLLRGILQAAMQALIDLEAHERIGAAPHERTAQRTTHRNGSRLLPLTINGRTQLLQNDKGPMG